MDVHDVCSRQYRLSIISFIKGCYSDPQLLFLTGYAMQLMMICLSASLATAYVLPTRQAWLCYCELFVTRLRYASIYAQHHGACTSVLVQFKCLVNAASAAQHVRERSCCGTFGCLIPRLDLLQYCTSCQRSCLQWSS
jgi:hypothetical protein